MQTADVFLASRQCHIDMVFFQRLCQTGGFYQFGALFQCSLQSNLYTVRGLTDNGSLLFGEFA